MNNSNEGLMTCFNSSAGIVIAEKQLDNIIPLYSEKEVIYRQYNST